MVEDSIEKLAKRGCGNKNSKRVRKKSAARQMTSGLRRAFQLDLTSRPTLTTNVTAITRPFHWAHLWSIVNGPKLGPMRAKSATKSATTPTVSVIKELSNQVTWRRR